MMYFSFVLYILFGILPSLIWLFYYLGKDIHPEPKRILLKVYLFGALVTLPVFLVQIWLLSLLDDMQTLPLIAQHPIITSVIKWFFIIALTEETLKYLGLRFTVLKDKVLDEPVDIMLYMIVVAAGFSGLENILYLFSPDDITTLGTALQNVALLSLSRFVGATLLHTLCSALLGYFLALSFLKYKNHFSLTIIGIVLASLLHGLYDFSIITLEKPFSNIIPVTIIVALGIFVVYAFDKIKRLKSICKV